MIYPTPPAPSRAPHPRSCPAGWGRVAAVLLLAWTLLAAPSQAQQTFTVTTAADAGAGSLRDAIAQANATPEADTILFQIDGGGSYQEIFLESLLLVTTPINLDGNTQGCDLSEGLCIRLDGAAVSGTPGMRLYPGSDGSRVHGLVFTRFQDERFVAFSVVSNDQEITGNYFGTDRTGRVTDPDGTPDTGDELGNDFDVIIATDEIDGVVYGSRNIRFGGPGAGDGNVFGGTRQVALNIRGGSTSDVVVQGNRIGVGVDGQTLLGAGANAVQVTNTEGVPQNVVIGGLEPGEGNYIIGAKSAGVLLAGTVGVQVLGNVISGNGVSGIGFIEEAAGSEVRGNYIGTTPDGLAALPNGTVEGLARFEGHGISFESGSRDNLVADNVISGNLLTGVVMGSFSPGDVTGNVIRDNLIGLDATGEAALPNGVAGIPETGFGVVAYGGVTASADNLVTGNFIGGNVTAGVLLDGPEATANAVHDNWIGVGQDLATPTPNGQAGIVLRNGAHGNHLGGLPPAETAPNALLFNPVSIGLDATAGTGNAFAHNVFGASAFDIDLGLDGPTANDADDADDGPNRGLNYPEISALDVADGVLQVTFRVDAAPANAAYPLSLQLYTAQDFLGAPVWLPLDSVATYAEAEAGTYVTRRFALSDDDAGLDLGPMRAVVFDADGNAGEMSPVAVQVAAVDVPALPERIALEPNYPNPFNPSTRIAYTLSAPGHVRLDVFDVMGRRVAALVDASQRAGRHEVVFDAATLPSGVYLYRLSTGGTVQQRSMMLVK